MEDESDKIEEKNAENKDLASEENLDESVPIFSDSEDEEHCDVIEEDEETEEDSSNEQDTILNAEGPKVLKRIHFVDDSDDEQKVKQTESMKDIENSGETVTHSQNQLLQTSSGI